MMIGASLANCIGAFLTMLFCLDITFGIPAFFYVLFTSTVTDTLYQCFNTLPLMVLFAKIIPEKIEASLFAFLMGLSNLSYMVLSGNIGNAINYFIVGVTYDDLSKVWELYAW